MLEQKSFKMVSSRGIMIFVQYLRQIKGSYQRVYNLFCSQTLMKDTHDLEKSDLRMTIHTQR